MTERPFLLCTDLDRTLLPNGDTPEDAEARPLLARLVAHPEVALAYVSGRDRGRVEQAIAEYDLPQPDLVVADVGTTIYDLRSGSWARWEAWDAEIAPYWSGRSHADLAAALQDLEPLHLQEATRQGPFKLSYEVGLEHDRGVLEAPVAERLEALGVRAARIWSVDEPAAIALLDIVPLGATKLHAASFLREALGIPLSDMLFAGDSGNDLEVLTSEIPAVLVANARPEVVERATRLAAQAGTTGALHLARGGWRGMSGCYGAGILEGMAHFHPRRMARWIPVSAPGEAG